MARSASPRPKWGAGSFSAWMRHGLKELRAVFYHDSPIGREAEMGMYGTATPHEVWNSRTKEPRSMNTQHHPNQSAPEQEHSMVDDRIKQAEQAQENQHQQQQEPPHEPE
jgi:hypothetical protein